MATSRQMFLIFAVVVMVVAIQAAQGDCPKNQELKSCGSACPPKCNDEPLACTLQCIVDVCQCKPGFVLNNQNECVTKEEC